MSDKPDFNDPRNHKRARSGQDRLTDHQRTYPGDLTDAQKRYDRHQADRRERRVRREISDAGGQGVAPSPSSSEAEPEP